MTQAFSSATFAASQFTAPAGGGDFAFEGVSLGVFLIDQPTHRIGVGSDRLEQKPLTAGQGWILPPGAAGTCLFDADHTFLAVTLAPSLLKDAGLENTAALAPRFGDHDPLLQNLAQALAAADGQSALYRQTMAQALAAQVAQVVAPPTPVEAGIDDARLRRAVAFIHDRLADDISLDALAAEAGMSPFHFARAFKAATGASPLQYVIRTRIETAQVLLRTTGLTVAEVAWRVGYDDTGRFGRHFKRQVGATPAVFRAA